jgi:membrane protease YdiL (CAAX protease family)
MTSDARAKTPGGTAMSILELFGPITLFVSVYVAIFLSVGYGGAAIGLPYPQWAGLIAAVAATAFTIRVAEGGRWPLGVFVSPRVAAIDFLLGVAFASALVLIADALIIATTNLRHVRGNGLPGFEVVVVFIPAAIHEELVFRGYLFQKMRVWSRGAAIGITSALFAILHAGNRGMSAVAMVNLFLAGVLLAFAYERFERLWFPIGIHLAWNLLSGPILGFGVSGYVARASLFRIVGSGPAWIGGGAFGIEGSAWMAAVEAGGIFLLSRRLQRVQ